MALPQAVGPRHPDVLRAMTNLAGVLEGTDPSGAAEAEALYRKAIGVRRETVGARHLDTLQIVKALARMLVDQSRLGEAQQLLGEVVAAYRETVGPSSPFTTDAESIMIQVALMQMQMTPADCVRDAGVAAAAAAAAGESSCSSLGWSSGHEDEACD